jgi:hypothetical protein
MRLILFLASFAMVVPLVACSSPTVFTGDVPIAWEDPQAGPNFWACLIAATDFTADAAAIAAVLTPLQGYGDAHIRVLANQGGPATAPTWDNTRDCIAFLRANASPGDVVLFYLSTHGARGCAPPVPGAVEPWRVARGG